MKQLRIAHHLSWYVLDNDFQLILQTSQTGQLEQADVPVPGLSSRLIAAILQF